MTARGGRDGIISRREGLKCLPCAQLRRQRAASGSEREGCYANKAHASENLRLVARKVAWADKLCDDAVGGVEVTQGGARWRPTLCVSPIRSVCLTRAYWAYSVFTAIYKLINFQ